MKKIAILDTAICTKNLGDQIIMDAVVEQLRNIFPRDFYFHLPTHEEIQEESYKLIDQSDFVLVGGTNLLSSNMDKYNQWKISRKDMRKLSRVILMGVGWWQYQDSPNRYTRRLFQSVLSSTGTQSVRDRYTLNKMQEMGIRNVLNTSCPTTWSLTPEHCSAIPEEQGDSVVMTLTDYNRDPVKDKYLWEVLRRSYRRVFLWVQGSQDYEYARTLFGADVEYVDPSVKAYDELLGSNLSLDYVGTRLHAGIRALANKRRTILISVDNRTIEMAADTKLRCVERSKLPDVKQLIDATWPTAIELPTEQIERWKKQFVQLENS
jgi:polysaccharide pyruvyl transferase WcaK-like protein